MYAREAEVFAAYTAYTDYEIGRVIQEVQDEGKLDNTLIIYIDGDNGTSAKAASYGTFNQMTAYNGILNAAEVKPVLAMNACTMNDWGSDKTYPHMSVAWSWAFDTPFKWTKQVASHFGGTRQGLAISWPGHIKDVGGIRTQFHHVIDIVPTILEAAGIQAPDDGQRDQAEADRRREHGSTRSTKPMPMRRRNATRSISRWSATARSITTAGLLPRRRPRPSWELGTGKLPDLLDGYKWELYQHRRGLFGVQRPCREQCRQAEGNAGAVPEGGGEIPGLPAG